MVAIAAMAFTVACGSDDDSSTAGGGGGSLNIRMPDDPADLDPHKGLSTIGLQFSYYMYDTLVSQSKDGEVVSKLATEWDVTPTSLKLTIRDDITCSDGTKMTPSVIKANLDRVKDPKTQSPYVDNFLGGPDYTVAANDGAGTVTIKLSKPFTPLLANLAQYPPMLCKAALDNPKTLQSRSVGTGPFILKKKVVDDHYTLAARKGYKWGPDGATTESDEFPQTVTLRVVPNETTATNQLESGELDLAPVSGPERERLQANQSLVSKDAGKGVSIIHFNEASGRPGADPAVRKALIQAIDREAMTQSGYGEFATVTETVLLPGSPCYSKEPGSSIPAFDAEAAKATLSEAAPSLKFYAISTEGGEYVAEAWKQAGAKVDINVSTEAGPGLDLVFGGGDWDAALFSWDGVTNIPLLQPYLSGPAPPDGTNFATIDNPTFTEQADLAKSDLGEKGCAGSTAAQSALYGAGDMLPISLLTTGYYGQENIGFDTFFGAIEPTSLRIGR